VERGSGYDVGVRCEEASYVGQEDEEIRPELGGDEGGEAVVVAEDGTFHPLGEGELSGRDDIVFVEDGDDSLS
jgi:hypothetical protein